MNMVKVVPLRFKQCFGPFTTLLLKGSSKTGLFRHLPNQVFRCPYFRKYISYGGHAFLKCSKFNVDLKNAQKNWENVFCFWSKCIWICCVRLPPLRREHLSLAVNVLTNRLKILDVTKSDFFKLNSLHSDQWIW